MQSGLLLEGYVWVCGPTIAGDFVDVGGSCCHQNLLRYPGSESTGEAMLISEGHLRPFQTEWPGLPPGAMVMSRTMFLLRSKLSGPVVLLQLRSVFMSIARVISGDM